MFLIPILFISCEKNDFELSENADEFFFLRNHGADLPVWVRGNTASKIMIIYLHGGPSGEGSFRWDTQESYFIKSLIKDYAVVFYDQRATGSSQGNFDESCMTEEQFVDDLDKLITLVYSKYGSDIHVFLYGLSWGGYLGTAYITSHDYQHKIKGWINDSGNHNQLKAANDGKEMLINYAQQQISLNKNKDEWSEIHNWCEQNDTIFELKDFAQWSNYAIKAERLMKDSTVSTFDWDSKIMRKSYFYSPYSASSVFSNSLFNHYVAENYKELNLSDKLNKIEIPVLFVRGKYDFSVPEQTIDEAFEKINSTIKYKKTFDKSGHSVGDGETDLFIDMIDDFIEENI
jgi:pimeloyl-ACP methyl ester carboxylesterase